MRAIIMAGGYGSRLRPLTNNMPKPMMNIINKPIIEYIIELLRRYGIREIAVTLGYLPKSIIDYFQDGSKWGVKLRYYIEDTPLGTAGSVRNAIDFIDGTTLIISGDALTNIDIEEFADCHQRGGKGVTMAVKYVEDVTGFGVVKADKNGEIISFIEKPLHSNEHLVNTGIYMIEKRVIERIPQGKYDFSKDLFPTMLRDMRVYRTEKYWSDIGTLSSYYLTNNDVVTHPMEFGVEF